MKPVFAEWERYLQQFEIGWKASDRSYFSISCLKYHQSISFEK